MARHAAQDENDRVPLTHLTVSLAMGYLGGKDREKSSARER
jgi:hypothetical protein